MSLTKLISFFLVLCPPILASAIIANVEPSARETQEMAIKYALFEKSRMEDLGRRSKISHWLPKIRTRVEGLEGGGLAMRKQLGQPDVIYERDRLQGYAGFVLEWNFSELIFDENEPSLVRTGIQISRARQRLLEEVTEIYFLRKRLKNDLEQLQNKKDANIFQLELKLEQLTARLDALTDGEFSRRLKSASHG